MSIDYFSDLEFVCHGEIGRSADLFRRDDFSYWGLQFFRRGQIMLQIDDNEPVYSEEAGVFVSHPGSRFIYGAHSNGTVENKLYICFRGERVKKYLAGGMLFEKKQDALIKIAEPDRFMHKMRAIRALLMLPNSPENHARAVLTLEQLLLDMQISEENVHARSDQRYDDFAALTSRITAAPEQNWNFEKEARKLSVSYAHFRRLFEQFFQVPPGAFLLSARLEKAAGLLSGTTLTIREIAHECGFQDEFYFSRIFKKYRALPPKSYRQNYR